MNIQNRTGTIYELIRQKKIGSQDELAQLLNTKGFTTTQSSLSRELKKLGVVKAYGQYVVPSVLKGESHAANYIDIKVAGENLIVVKTDPGNGGRIGAMIDSSNNQEILGTIAGDDTVFIAVASHKHQSRVIRKILTLF